MKPERLTLDFGAARRQTTPLARVLLALGLAALGWFCTQGAKAWNTHRLQTNALAELEVRQKGEQTAATRAPTIEPGQLAQLRLVRSAAQSLQTPWSDLLAALESAPSDSVALLSIEPSVQTRMVRLTAEARHARAMLGYVAALQKDARLSQVVLVSHQVQLQAPGTPVRFQLQATWGDGR